MIYNTHTYNFIVNTRICIVEVLSVIIRYTINRHKMNLLLLLLRVLQ